MPDKNLTDNEIVKALECCSTYKGKCTDCPAFVKVDRSNCKQVLLGAIDLINRLQAENDNLKNDELPRCKDALRRANEIGMELQAENERLKNAYKQCVYERDAYIEIENNAVTEAKAEAYKECIEKVKERLFTCVTDTQQMVIELRLDNLLKEMVGDK